YLGRNDEPELPAQWPATCRRDDRRGVIAMGADQDSGDVASEPSASAVSFITTEHFTLQGARSATIAESTGRASMFLASVAGGVVALGGVATATQVGGAGFPCGALLLRAPGVVWLGGVEAAFRSGIEDLGYARRIARLRAYYFDKAPELAPYLLSARPDQRLFGEGLSRGYYAQGFRTVAGMVGVITAVLAGSEVGLAVATAFDAP